MPSSLIYLEGVSKAYTLREREILALRDIDLQIDQGDYVAIMGPSGSGKSTLMSLIGLLDRSTCGTYYLDTVNTNELSVSTMANLRRDKIGIVFQNFNLLPRNTAVENVELPLLYSGVPAKARRAKAIEALKSVGLGTKVDDRPYQLSGGEQQRVAIARAIVNDPAILLADEPTGALDSQTGLEVLELFEALNGNGQTILLVTHNPNVSERAKRLLNLKDGRKLSDQVMQH